MLDIFKYISVFILSYIGVEVFRRWTIKKEILDIPNERSSHKRPTPMGGGLVIVFITLLSLAVYQFLYSKEFAWSFFIGSFFISLISWLDDLYDISVIWRFIIQFGAAIIILIQFGYFSEIYIPLIGNLELQMLGAILLTLWIVWLTNSFNFMDGIDGLAGIQAITAAFGWSLVGYLLNYEIYQFIGLIILSTTLGFLLHNWQPAKIFMGDVGSAFLGYTFAVLPLLALGVNTNLSDQKYLFFIGVMFVWLFVFDTIITLLRRILNKEKIWKAHRSHLYQKMVINNMKHSSVSILYGVLSIAEVLVVIYCLILNRYEILFGCLTLMITVTLVLFVYHKKMLTNEV